MEIIYVILVMYNIILIVYKFIKFVDKFPYVLYTKTSKSGRLDWLPSGSKIILIENSNR